MKTPLKVYSHLDSHSGKLQKAILELQKSDINSKTMAGLLKKPEWVVKRSINSLKKKEQ